METLSYSVHGTAHIQSPCRWAPIAMTQRESITEDLRVQIPPYLDAGETSKIPLHGSVVLTSFALLKNHSLLYSTMKREGRVIRYVITLQTITHN